MLDLSKYPSHVQKALETIDLVADARKRVARGVKWLDSAAPADWRLQMISIRDGRVYSHVRICRDDENPLALAFRRDSRFKRSDDRVSWATVSKHFFVSPTAAEIYGFVEKDHYAPDNVYIDKMTDGKFLDDAWAEALSNLAWQAQPVAAYPKVA